MGVPLTLIAAAESHLAGGEDRLTEILAVVLDAHHGVCDRLQDLLGLPRCTSYRVDTQYSRDSRTRIDLRLFGIGASHNDRSVVYFENKRGGYLFGAQQPQRELEALRKEPAHLQALICVAPESERAKLRALAGDPTEGSESSLYDCFVTWREFAALVHDAGREWGDAEWRDKAYDPEAPARQRLLAEFLDYLEEDDVLDALNDAELEAIRLAERAQKKLAELCRLASGRLDGLPAVVSKRPNDIVYPYESQTGVSLVCVDYELPHGHWAIAESSALTLVLAASDATTPGFEGVPTAYAGLFLADDEAERARADQPWMEHLTAEGYRPLPNNEGLWLCRHTPLRSFTNSRGTLTAQAEAIANWLQGTLNDILAAPRPRRAAPSHLT